MKKATLKKFFAMLMALVMVFSLTACMDDSEKLDKKENGSKTEEEGDVTGEEVKTADKLENEDMQYVLVYNPNIYDENSKNLLTRRNDGG